MAKIPKPEDREPQMLARAQLERMDTGYEGELIYFGIKLYARAVRWGAGIKLEIFDKAPQ